jgi:uncharacterized protein (TIGR03437 family)
VRQAAVGFAGLVLAVFLGAAPLAAAVQVAVPGWSAAPGGSVAIPVMCASRDGFASGIQFDLLYDGAAVGVSATAGDAAGNAGKILVSADVAPGAKRFVVLGLNQDGIHDGVLVNLLVDVNSDASRGEYRLEVSNVVATDANGQAIAVIGVDGVLVVQGTASSGSPLLTMSVFNGGSYLAGPVAPGEIVTLSGAGIGPAAPQQPVGSATSAELGGVSVLFDGTPSPMLYAGPNQINLVVPYEAYGEAVTRVRVRHGDLIVAALFVSVADAAPAVFTLDASGVGPGAILNRDWSINTPSNPADKGSVVSLYAMGAGQTDPPGANGQITGDVLAEPLLPVSVQIDNLDAEVSYAGAAPALVAGVIQVNCIIPANARSGSAVPVVLNVGRTSSQPGVTLAVK